MQRQGKSNNLGVISPSHFVSLQMFHPLLPKELHVRKGFKILCCHYFKKILLERFADPHSIFFNCGLQLVLQLLAFQPSCFDSCTQLLCSTCGKTCFTLSCSWGNLFVFPLCSPHGSSLIELSGMAVGRTEINWCLTLSFRQQFGDRMVNNCSWDMNSNICVSVNSYRFDVIDDYWQSFTKVGDFH